MLTTLLCQRQVVAAPQNVAKTKRAVIFFFSHSFLVVLFTLANHLANARRSDRFEFPVLWALGPNLCHLSILPYLEKEVSAGNEWWLCSGASAVRS